MKRVGYQIKALFLLPQHLHNFLIQVSLLEDRIKFNFISRLDDIQNGLLAINRRLELEHEISLKIIEKLDEIKKRVK